MANLSTSTSEGFQTTTQTPQSATGASSGGTDSSRVQTGTQADALTSQGGVPLTPARIEAINLNSVKETKTIVATPTHKQHLNPALMGVSGVLFAGAILLFWLTARAGKKHSDLD